MSRILWARNVGSIDLQAVEQDDGSVTIEARIAIAGSFTIKAEQQAKYMDNDMMYDVVTKMMVKRMRDEARAVADETDEAKRP